jgi:uncharacterized protein (TIGR01777 family)
MLDDGASAGRGFLATLCEEWEQAAFLAADASRVVCCRFGLALARDGGALQAFARPFRWGLGAKFGDGKQYISWIDIEDLVSALLFAVENEEVAGPVNFTAQNPVTNDDFTRALSKRLRRPRLFRAPRSALRLLLGEMGEETLLFSQRAVPQKLLEAGFEFQFPELEQSLRMRL